MTSKAGKDIGSSTRWTVMAELKRLNVTVLTGAKAVGIRSEGLEILKDGTLQTLPADTVVVAAGSMPVNDLKKCLETLVEEVHIIGDAKEPRNALEAIREGFLTGLKI
jgi:2,4-dienoyl-CoA reductase (NADPH2)